MFMCFFFLNTALLSNNSHTLKFSLLKFQQVHKGTVDSASCMYHLKVHPCCSLCQNVHSKVKRCSIVCTYPILFVLSIHLSTDTWVDATLVIVKVLLRTRGQRAVQVHAVSPLGGTPEAELLDHRMLDF